MDTYEKKYKEALERAEALIDGETNTSDALFYLNDIKSIFSELQESEDEKIRTELINGFKECLKNSQYPKNAQKYWHNIKIEDILAWLEKQGGITKLSEEEQNKFAKGVLTSCALSFIDYLDAHKYEGKMCVSNGECEEIENAFHNAMWDRLHRYYCKYIEKQGEKEEVDANETNGKHQDIMKMLQSIYEVLVSINNNHVQVIPYTPQPLEPFYDISKPYCNTTNKIEDNERPKESL